MGNTWAHYVSRPDTTPADNVEPSYPPTFGFPSGRKEKVMIATKEEMQQANIPFEERDYCAHYYIQWQKCVRDEYPLQHRCRNVRHLLDDCKHNDHIDRKMEYERERRLNERTKRKKRKEQALE